MKLIIYCIISYFVITDFKGYKIGKKSFEDVLLFYIAYLIIIASAIYLL